MIHYNIIQTPIGNINILTNKKALLGVFFDSNKHLNFINALGPKVLEDKNELIEETSRQIQSYLRGEGKSFNIPYNFEYGSEADHEIWECLRSIPYGEKLTYKQVAEKVRRPTSARAVANAIGRNPLSIIIPCHRVIGSDGKLRGYAGGIDIKEALLKLEGII